jgi:hypothetical protein
MPSSKKLNKKLPKRKTQKKHSPLHKYYTVIVSVLSAFILGIVIGGYFYIDSYEEAENLDIKKLTPIELSTPQPTFKEKADALNIEYANDEIEKVLQKQEPKEQTKPKFHFEEPDYGKVDEVIEEAKKLQEEKSV